MLNRKDRKLNIHIITLDRILAMDVYERLVNFPGVKGANFILPRDDDEEITVDDIDRMALDTMTSRLLVIDVRSHTLPRLQQVYNKIVGYNRCDFNLYCNTMVIGDGPAGLFKPDTGAGVFVPLLAKLRIDYSAAVFFHDPLMDYSPAEKAGMGVDGDNSLPEIIPEHLKDGFKGQEPTISQIRSYFRAEATEKDQRAGKVKRRLTSLSRLYYRELGERFPEDADKLKAAMGRKGCKFTGEALSLNVYPFHFEQWAAKLLKKAKKAIIS